MTVLKQSRKILTALTLALVLTVSMALGSPSRQISAAASSLRIVAIAPVTVLADTAIERRLDATTDEVRGQIREKYGELADSPEDEVKGGARRLSGEARNRVEDLGDKARDASEAVKDQGEGLVDRVKDFFDADNAETGIDTDDRITGTRRTGSY